ncbi:dynein regulatory complex protein 9-like [Rhynchophorus ferrugineus]|uniref:dynein regulatory complex protein 9-like n=1 Tax=Rhynchophorus ferrugineus TaxID=354439 RepID=UPI003FCD1101
MNPEISKKLSKELILCVLGENLDKLSILKNIYGWSENEQTVVQYKTIVERYSDLAEDSGVLTESKEKIDLVDFQKDCSFIEATLQKSFDEIRSSGTYNQLTKLTQIFKTTQNDEKSFLEDTKTKEKEFIMLQEQYLMEQKQFITKIGDTMKKIGILKDELEDFKEESKIKGNYIEQWNKARTEIHDYEIQSEESNIMVNINKKKQDFLKEQRVHQEIRNIFNEFELDMQQEIKGWKIKYDHDLQKINEKIKCLKVKKDQQQNCIISLNKQYTNRQKSIDDYKAYKVKKEIENMEKEKRNKAATKIQAWWRGVMVRKGFGKYKKKRDKKNKKKTDKKK